MEILNLNPAFVYLEEIETKTILDETDSGKDKTRYDWPTGTINGVEQACARRTFRLSYKSIKQSVYNSLTQFYLARKGQTEAFWWENFNESPIITVYPNKIIVIANYQGATTTTLAHYPIIPNTQTIYDDGVALAEGVDYSIIDTTGVITWIINPANGSVITANYRFYREVRFKEEKLSPERIAYQVYNIDILAREIQPRL